MATDVNLQIINSMTQEQMQSLKDSNGKIPSLANQLVMTEDDTNSASGSSIKLLWTNPKMDGSAFNSQTITLTSSDYDFLVVKSSKWESNGGTYFWSIISSGANVYSLAETSGQSNDTRYEIRTRDATVNGATVTFGDCKFACAGYPGSSVNTNAVPLEIYGVKGV